MLSAATIPPIRLLITDRQPASQEALIGLFRKLGSFEFVGIVPPEEAIRQAALRRVNVVLLDVLKPHDSSVRLCQGLCALSPRPTVIALTTFANLVEEQALRAAGAADYLLKEVRLEKLVHAIHQIHSREQSTSDRSSSLRQP